MWLWTLTGFTEAMCTLGSLMLPVACTRPVPSLSLRQVSAVWLSYLEKDPLKAHLGVRVFLASSLHFFPGCQASLECFPSLHQVLVNLLPVSFLLSTSILENFDEVYWFLIGTKSTGAYFFFLFKKWVLSLGKLIQSTKIKASNIRSLIILHNKNEIKCILHVLRTQTKPGYPFPIQNSCRGAEKGNNETRGW